jgi:hypothetical protein
MQRTTNTPNLSLDLDLDERSSNTKDNQIRPPNEPQLLQDTQKKSIKHNQIAVLLPQTAFAAQPHLLPQHPMRIHHALVTLSQHNTAHDPRLPHPTILTSTGSARRHSPADLTVQPSDVPQGSSCGACTLGAPLFLDSKLECHAAVAHVKGAWDANVRLRRAGPIVKDQGGGREDSVQKGACRGL